jgi:hypothetical protein
MQAFERLQSMPSMSPARAARRGTRPAIFALVLAALFALGRGADVDEVAPNRSAALAESLAARGLTCEPKDVTWLTGPAGVGGAIKGGAHALVRAAAAGESNDLYLVEARLSPEGVLLEVGDMFNVTRTRGVDVERPVIHGSRVAYLTRLDALATGIHTIDLAGHAPSAYADFTRLQRWQTALGNLQQTGQTRGVVHATYALDPVAREVDLSWQQNGLLHAVADGRAITIDADRGVAVEGAGWVREAPEEAARPPDLPQWAADRLRKMAWIGDKRTFWLKAVAFTALDWVSRARASLFADTTERDVAEDLGGVNSGGGQAPVYSDPELGWPPKPMLPILSPPLAGEGQWLLLDHDPFITRSRGLPAPFVTSFLRTDKQRRDTRIYMTLWDPRQVALHMEAGTVEPVSASGEAGSGLVPRVPEVMKRLVAGFNGGFQAMHGEYGMQVSGVMYLPPKPYAATVMELRDGTTAFGAWPPSGEVPAEVLSYRQNLTALVQNGKFNPWGRGWWGGTPPGWQDNIHTTRSGICLTKENFVGYFFGADIASDTLAQGMLAARCVFGVHLDMNPGLAGFEFYNVEPKSEYSPLGRPLQADWEAEASIHDLPDLHVYARRMTRSMVEVNFPQYIHREARDFFYLTLRPVLPGANLGPTLAGGTLPPGPDDGAWQVKGLPQHGFPYSIATTSLPLDAAKHGPAARVRILRVDPRTVRPAASAGTTEETPTVVSLFGGGRLQPGAVGVWLADGVFVTGENAPPDGVPVAAGVPLSKLRKPPKVALGVQDEEGWLTWIELSGDVQPGASTAAAIDGLLAKMGCSTRIFVSEDSAQAVLGGSLDLAGNPIPLPATPSTRLVRGAAPSARPYFESTPIVGPSVWQPLQSQRIRYFFKPSRAPSDAGVPDAAATSTPPIAPRH